jgi:alkaline phosphatase
MMVEGGKIDWAGHANDAAAAVHDVVALDEAIEMAIEFYNEHSDETLILVTADHETGAMGLGHGATKYESNLGLLKYQKSSLEELNKIVGQFRVNKSGDSDADFDRMLKVLETDLGLNSRQAGIMLDSTEMATLKTIFKESVYGMTTEKGTYGEYEPFMSEAVKIMNKKAGISWGTTSHTAINVPVYSIGVGSELFSGYIDNTDIPKAIGKLMGIW